MIPLIRFPSSVSSHVLCGSSGLRSGIRARLWSLQPLKSPGLSARDYAVARSPKKNPNPRNEGVAKLVAIPSKPDPISSRSMTKPQDKPTRLATTSYQNYAATLAQKRHPTLLYAAPSSSGYIFASYSAATFCIGYGVLSYWNNYLYAPPDIAIWVPYAFAGISFAMVLFGVRFLFNPIRMVRRITATPKTDHGKLSLEMEVELTRLLPLPLVSPRVMRVAPHDIILPIHIARPLSASLSPSAMRRLKIAENLRKQQDLEYERSHIMSAGIRHMWRAISRGFYSLFRVVQKSFTRENFFEMRIKDKSYKMDLEGGWLLDDGKAIDRLAVLRPQSNISFINKLTSS